MTTEEDPTGTWVRGGERPAGVPRPAGTEPPAGHPSPPAPSQPAARPLLAARAPGSRGARLALVAVATAVVAGGAFAGGWFARTPAAPAPTTTLRPAPPAPFAVTGLAVHLAAGRLSCPAAVAHLSATIDVDHGGGSILYQWLLPSRSVTKPTRITLRAGQTSALVTLAYTLTGRGALAGDASLRLLAPIAVYSPAVLVRYVCASKPKPKPKPKTKAPAK